MPKASLDNQSDAIAWQQMRAGSKEAFEELYDKYFPLLFRYGLRFCSERAVVSDSLQDFFVDLYVRRSSLSEVQYVKNYLYTAFRHRIIRKISGKHLLVEALSDTYHFEVVFSHEQILIRDQLDEFKRQKLLKAFQQLSSRQKEAIFLRYYENMSYEEIAEILKMKEVKYARTLVYRALSSLKAGLKDLKGSLTLYSAFPLLGIVFSGRHRQ